MSDKYWIEIAKDGEGIYLTEMGCGCCEKYVHLDQLDNPLDELETLELYLKEQLDIVAKVKSELIKRKKNE